MVMCHAFICILSC